VHCDHEYLNFKGTKLSKSRGTAVEVPYFLSKYDPDPLRFYLTATAPETRDTEACPERSRQLFGTQHVVEYQEETRSHEALTYTEANQHITTNPHPRTNTDSNSRSYTDS
jgi:leucyl-tRNA synthetase